MIVDIVPFTGSIESLYAPLALLDRQILGYQHGYSFSENNLEQDQTGDAHRAHDPNWLAQKLVSFATIDYEYFTHNQTTIVECPLTKKEKVAYELLKETTIDQKDYFNPVVTVLADWTNILPLRYEKLALELENYAHQKLQVYTNLGKHNIRLQKRFPDLRPKTFTHTNGDEDQYDLVILFELPIVKRYLFWDVLANIREDCKLMIFYSGNSAEQLLYEQMTTDLEHINALTTALYRKEKLL